MNAKRKSVKTRNAPKTKSAAPEKQNAEWFWYVARGNEIFCDLDSRKALGRAVGVLRRAIRRGYLDVQSVWQHESSPGKHHMIVTLKYDLAPVSRALWAMWMGSDKVRGIYTIQRIDRNIHNADILISRHDSMGGRGHEYACHCKEKHKALRITRTCPVMLELLSYYRDAEFFPRNRDRVRHSGRLPWGYIPLSMIKRS